MFKAMQFVRVNGRTYKRGDIIPVPAGLLTRLLAMGAVVETETTAPQEPVFIPAGEVEADSEDEEVSADIDATAGIVETQEKAAGTAKGRKRGGKK